MAHALVVILRGDLSAECRKNVSNILILRLDPLRKLSKPNDTKLNFYAIQTWNLKKIIKFNLSNLWKQIILGQRRAAWHVWAVRNGHSIRAPCRSGFRINDLRHRVGIIDFHLIQICETLTNIFTILTNKMSSNKMVQFLSQPCKWIQPSSSQVPASHRLTTNWCIPAKWRRPRRRVCRTSTSWNSWRTFSWKLRFQFYLGTNADADMLSTNNN